jgi:hypothetical protein
VADDTTPESAELAVLIIVAVAVNSRCAANIGIEDARAFGKEVHAHQSIIPCMDLPGCVLRYGTLQATDRGDILNVGGFSDAVFEVIAAFAEGKLGPGYWAGKIVL